MTAPLSFHDHYLLLRARDAMREADSLLTGYSRLGEGPPGPGDRIITLDRLRKVCADIEERLADAQARVRRRERTPIVVEEDE